MTRWLISAIALVMMVGTTAFPWYSARTIHGRATMNWLGQWTVDGELGAALRPLPFGILVWVLGVAMVYCAVRGVFGGTIVCAMGSLAVGLIAVLGTSLADRHLPGGDSVGITVEAAATSVVAVGLSASIVCWIAFARCVLRPAPR